MAETLDYYLNLKNSLLSQIAAREAHNRKVAEEIRRLEEAYNKLGNIKRINDQCADKVVNDATLKNIAGDAKWKGRYKDTFDFGVKRDVVSNAGIFAGSIDSMQDEVGRALDKKRGEYNTGWGLLNNLNSRLSSVMGTIRNWVN